jgi:hypothetical protein
MAVEEWIKSTIYNELKTQTVLLLRPVTDCIIDLNQKEIKR